MTHAKPTFEPLSKLFRGDHGKIRLALGIFHDATRGDLERLDQAYAGNDRMAIRKMMHKMKSACMQIGEDAAAEAISVVERALDSSPGGDAFAHAFKVARDELDRVQARVAGYLSVESGAPEA